MNWVRMMGVTAPPPVPVSSPEPVVTSGSTCGSPKTTAAPSTAPPTEPSPPTITMARNAIEILIPNVPYSLSSGLRISNHSTVIAPASPAYPDDTANAPALARTTDTPSTDAAASLSRTARQARPGRPRTAALASSQATTVSARNRYHIRSAPPRGTPAMVNGGSALPKEKPNRLNGSGSRPREVVPASLGSDCPRYSPMNTSDSEATPR